MVVPMMGPGSYYQGYYPMSLAPGDVDLGGGQTQTGVGQRVKKGIQATKAKGQQAISQLGLDNPANRNMLFNRSAMLGGLTAIPSVVEQYQSGNTLGAATTAATAGLGTLGAGAIGGRIGGGRGALVTTGLSLLGGLLAPAAGDLVGKVTGKGDTQGAARTRRTRDAAAQAKVTEMLTSAGLQPYLAAQKDLMGYAADIDIQNLKRQAPIIKEQLDNALVRQQALNASNAQNYMAMGTVATAGRLATGAQEQAGANFRTAITANPYAGNVLQAPDISFG